MNRYESAYRDYTHRGDSTPQRPERKGRPGRAAAAVLRQDSSRSSGEESHSSRGAHLRQLDAGQNNRGYTTDEESYHPDHHHPISSMRELSDRSGGERSNSEYIVTNEMQVGDYRRTPSDVGSGSLSDGDPHEDSRDGQRYYMDNRPGVDEVPEIYIPRPEYLHQTPASELSQGSYRTYRSAPYSEDVNQRSQKNKRSGIVIETMRAPHPMCPNTRSCCCLMLLFNLGLLLICLGFVIVLQLNDPPFVWYLGVFMLVFGFVSIAVGLVFCAWMCREGSPDAPLPPNSQLYWTHHWRKTIHLPETHGRVHETPVKEPIDHIEEIRYPDHDESDSYNGGQGHRYHHNTSRY